MAKYRALAVIAYDVPDDYEPSQHVSGDPRGIAYGVEEIEGSECEVIAIVGEAGNHE